MVEVRQGTLGVDGRGWGPTENTVDRESQLSRRTRRTTRGGGQREEEDNERRRRGEEEEEEEDQATDIKSNNPHLAGGEKKSLQTLWRFLCPIEGLVRQPFSTNIQQRHRGIEQAKQKPGCSRGNLCQLQTDDDIR